MSRIIINSSHHLILIPSYCIGITARHWDTGTLAHCNSGRLIAKAMVDQPCNAATLEAIQIKSEGGTKRRDKREGQSSSVPLLYSFALLPVSVQNTPDCGRSAVLWGWKLRGIDGEDAEELMERNWCHGLSARVSDSVLLSESVRQCCQTVWCVLLFINSFSHFPVSSPCISLQVTKQEP